MNVQLFFFFIPSMNLNLMRWPVERIYFPSKCIVEFYVIAVAGFLLASSGPGCCGERNENWFTYLWLFRGVTAISHAHRSQWFDWGGGWIDGRPSGRLRIILMCQNELWLEICINQTCFSASKTARRWKRVENKKFMENSGNLFEAYFKMWTKIYRISN